MEQISRPATAAAGAAAEEPEIRQKIIITGEYDLVVEAVIKEKVEAPAQITITRAASGIRKTIPVLLILTALDPLHLPDDVVLIAVMAMS
jgi:hypothetical protein